MPYSNCAKRADQTYEPFLGFSGVDIGVHIADRLYSTSFQLNLCTAMNHSVMIRFSNAQQIEELDCHLFCAVSFPSVDFS